MAEVPRPGLEEREAPGIDRERVAAWLSAQDVGLTAPFEYELVAGGRSNLTFRVEDAGGRGFVLRRPPLGHTLPSAHDMAREHRIITALQGSPVPVPRPLALCEDETVNGATFYAMEFVDGWILRDPEVAARAFPEPERRARISDSLVGVLVDMHLVDPGEIGLGELGRHHGYLERQLKRWSRQWEESKTRELGAVEEVHRRLSAGIPEQQRVSIVHGDYRLDNVVSGRDAEVAAVLDWELCTLGDPLADLGGLLASWVQEGEDGTHALGGTPSSLPGFPTREELIAAYGERSGLDVSGIDYYMAFAFWKLACIGEGVYARYRAGVMGDDATVSVEDLARRVDRLAELAEASCPPA